MICGQDIKSIVKTFILLGIPIFLIFLALFELPIKYYIFLRYYIFFSVIFVAYFWLKDNDGIPTENLMVLFVIALVFNPFFIFSFSKQIWKIIDVCALLIYMIQVTAEVFIVYMKDSFRLEKVLEVFTVLMWIIAVVPFGLMIISE